jgi:hypothetical protein
MSGALASNLTLRRLNLTENVLERLSTQCDCLSGEDCDNYWIPRSSLEQPGASATFLERWIATLYEQVVQGTVLDEFVGVEFWVQVRKQRLAPLQMHLTMENHARHLCAAFAHSVRYAVQTLEHVKCTSCHRSEELALAMLILRPVR